MTGPSADWPTLGASAPSGGSAGAAAPSVGAGNILIADGDRPREGGADRAVVDVAVGVLVRSDGAFLLTSRPPGKVYEGYWEFPGGKVEPGERPEETLIRELHEEIGIDVSEPCLAPLTFASHAYETFHLLMPLYICRRWDGEVVAREGQNLKWVRANKLRDYPMPPADIPLIPHLIDLLM